MIFCFVCHSLCFYCLHFIHNSSYSHCLFVSCIFLFLCVVHVLFLLFTFFCIFVFFSIFSRLQYSPIEFVICVFVLYLHSHFIVCVSLLLFVLVSYCQHFSPTICKLHFCLFFFLLLFMFSSYCSYNFLLVVILSCCLCSLFVIYICFYY